MSACFGDTRRVFERKIRLPVVNFLFFFCSHKSRERERERRNEREERETERERREREREAPTGLHKKKESSLFPQHLSLFATNTNALSLSLSLCTHSRCGWKSNQNRYRINEYRHSSCIRNRFESFARIRRRS